MRSKIEYAYKFCKLDKRISWVEIDPESPLLLKFLFNFVIYCLHEMAQKKITIEWFSLDLKNHKQSQFGHTNHLKDPNLNFHLILMNYKNLSRLFVLQYLILLFFI